jgi:hypothetical protein
MNTTETKQTRYLSCAETAKEVRKELKSSFPGIKFSVRSSNYAGGASISIGWTDGPTCKAVEKVTNQFEGASFDSMQDLKTSHTSELNGEIVHHGSDYIFTRRALSVEFLTNIATQYCNRYREEMPEIKTWGSKDSAYIEENYSDHWHSSNQIMRKANETNEQDLDKLFAKEDAEIAEMELWRAAKKAEKSEETLVIEESPVEEQEEVIEEQEQENPFVDFVATVNAIQAQYTKEKWEQMAHTTVATFTAGEIIEASEHEIQEEEQEEKYIDPRSDSSAPNSYRFDPVSRIHWLEFPGKPDEDTIKLLKDEGWRWSSYRKQWRTNRRWAQVPAGIPYYNEGECDYSAERAERLEARAEKASQKGQVAYNKAHHIGSFIPMGQPILIGHHSEKRHRKDLERIDNGMRTFVNESDKAERLQDKAADSISHRAYLERPGVIHRRIQRLEATLRKLERQKGYWSNEIEYNRRITLLTQEINENKVKLEKTK